MVRLIIAKAPVLTTSFLAYLLFSLLWQTQLKVWVIFAHSLRVQSIKSERTWSLDWHSWSHPSQEAERDACSIGFLPFYLVQTRSPWTATHIQSGKSSYRGLDYFLDIRTLNWLWKTDSNVKPRLCSAFVEDTIRAKIVQRTSAFKSSVYGKEVDAAL